MADTKVIVLDPGHGGENHGLEYDGFLEKEMNLSVAQQMKAELEKYDGVTVYITNPDCTDMSLKQRAEYAKSVEADLLISLHFNMSENHQLFGSEVWVPSAGENHSWMHTLGDIFLEELTQKGFISKGVKTRLNGKGLDYYGILRESAALDIPAILVEHCYADEERDAAYLRQEDSLHNFAIGDATAVAKFYGLQSESLGIDYSTYVKNAYFIPESTVLPDETAPEEIELTYVNCGEQKENASASFVLHAKEPESELCYYDYSLDGGETWSELFAWDSTGERITFEVEQLPTDAKVMARVYNGYFIQGESNILCFIGEKTDSAKDITSVTKPAVKDEDNAKDNRPHDFNAASFILMAAGLLALLCVIVKAFRTDKKRVVFYGFVTVVLFAAGIMLASVKDEKTKNTEQAVAVTSDSVQPIVNKELQTLTLKEKDKECYEIRDEQLELLLEQNQMSEKTETVYDIQRGYLRVPSLEGVVYNDYDFSRITEQNGYKYYTGITGDIQSEIGIDVSKFQGDIDWALVKESGIQFAMLRVGMRGYGSGKLVTDEKFYVNLEGALSEGIKVGTYFFSAAINEAEAIEEADYVAKALEGYPIEMPVVFDTEPIYYDDARTDDLTPNQLTIITRAFCERIRSYGYTPMIYANAKRLTCVLHLEELADIDLWYADYQEKPIFPYAYRMWQYTEHGSVPGISGEVDLNVYFNEADD